MKVMGFFRTIRIIRSIRSIALPRRAVLAKLHALLLVCTLLVSVFSPLLLFPNTAYAADTVVFLTSGTSWAVPSDWDSSANTIEVIGGGGGGAHSGLNVNGGGGGGGGAYSKVTNATLTAGNSVTIAVGSGGSGDTAGGDTYFCNSTSNCASIAGTAVVVGAKGGERGSVNPGAGGSGGQAASGVGTTKYNGGNGNHGALFSEGGGGGGGAAGPGGAGKNGGMSDEEETGGGGGGGAGGGTSTVGTSSGGSTGGNGGAGPNGTGGGSGGTSGNNGTNGSDGGGGGGGGAGIGAGGTGGTGTEWDATHGSGGGGGGGQGNGGTYGGGGGGEDFSLIGGGSGAQGIIVITYTVPFVADTTITSNSSITGGADVTNELSKGSGTFVIDHPLDPENKLLYHSFVESPDVKNIYDGIVDLNKDGETTVELPSYFLALNKDFRYQFFPIGEPMPDLYLKDEIRKRFFGLFGAPVFRIAGGIPNGRISWQVTGIRHDPYILEHPIKTEVKKGAGQSVQKGIYLHPELYD